MNWYKKSQSSSAQIIAYHGSEKYDLEKYGLQYGDADYYLGGGLGGGVYVGLEPETAEFYGKYVYKILVNLTWDQIFIINPENENCGFLDGYGDSISSGEQVPPFWFKLGETHYAVTSMDGDADDIINYSDSNDRIVKLLDNESKTTGNFLFTLMADEFRRLPFDQTIIVDDVEDKFNDVVFAWFEQHQNEWNKLVSQKGDESLAEKYVMNMIDQAIDSIITIIKSVNEADGDSVKYLGISMEDIGPEVRSSGYKAIYLSNIRPNPTEELLVFDPKDVQIIENLTTGEMPGEIL